MKPSPTPGGTGHLFPLLAAVFLVISLNADAAVLQGTVRSAASAAVLQSMTVAAYDTTGSVLASGTTDSTGRYKITFGGGRIRLLAFDGAGVYATTFSGSADSYETSPELNVGGSDTVTTDFSMALGATIMGTANVSGAPAGGITIAAYNLSGTRRSFTRTIATGAYALVVPSGSYKLVAYDDAGNYAPIFFASKVSFGDATTVAVKAPAASVADFTLTAAGFLGGLVIDRATNLGLGSINVYAYTSSGSLAASTTTNPSGRFRMSLASGTYRIAAGDPAGSYAAAFGGDVKTFDLAPPINVAAAQTSPDATIIMDRGGKISGRVTDTAGHSIAAATVTAYNLDGTARARLQSDANGVYSILLPGGSFKLAAWDDQVVFVPSFYQQRRDFAGATGISVTAGQIANGFDFTLDKAGRFTGSVADASGTPLPSMTVAAYDSTLTVSATATTDSAGQFRLGVPSGTYRLVSWDNSHTFANAFDGGVSNLEAIPARSVASEETQNASFTMRPGIRVSGKVVTSDFTPVGGIEVQALDLAGNHIAAATSGNDGSFLLTLLPSSYKLLAIDPNHRYPAAYYDRAGSIGTAGTVVVPSNGSPAPLTIIVSSPSRRRVAGH